MKRACMLIGLCLVVLLFANPALGEFYKYRDSSGVLRFTDNLADVPPDQRPGAKSYKEADDYLTPNQRQERAEKARRETEVAAKEEKQGAFEAEQDQRMNLNKTRIALDEEYGALMRDKETIQKEKEQATTPEQLTAYRKRVNELNKRIIEYESRRYQYEESIKRFNAKARETQ